ncbi:hypothetical protein PPL_09202 [Heterostelium album PN500]|uniref:Uncharacterized protein n=1 Tax=Heterostelium pallidum (strain ATCC 26659 / Pp 5 / PN500) TaxID=670386 RepID=D3BKX0_HETP5|nr:hypothetical protein PPL_09202 [Heterostelium album PN500]EFA78550.1 hypothetical protein PPL_09202 [Heterostelium album PN500]|eukprot:XP_020430674.1 hypothetical protein PPL_09202 [Heterostelium album PN500]
MAREQLDWLCICIAIIATLDFDIDTEREKFSKTQMTNESDEIVDIIACLKIIEYLWSHKSLTLKYRLSLGLVSRVWFNRVSYLFNQNSHFMFRHDKPQPLTDYIQHLDNPLCPMKNVRVIKKYDKQKPDSVDPLSGLHFGSKEYARLVPIYSNLNKLELSFLLNTPLVFVQFTLKSFIKYSGVTDTTTTKSTTTNSNTEFVPVRTSLRSLTIELLSDPTSIIPPTKSMIEDLFDTILNILSPIFRDLESLTIDIGNREIKSTVLIRLLENHPNLQSLTLNFECGTLQYQKELFTKLPQNLKFFSSNMNPQLLPLESLLNLEQIAITNLLDSDLTSEAQRSITHKMRNNTKIKRFSHPFAIPVDISTKDLFLRCTHLNEFHISLESTPLPTPINVIFHSNLRKLTIDCLLNEPLNENIMLGLDHTSLVNLESLTINVNFGYIFDLLLKFIRGSKSLRHLDINRPGVLYGSRQSESDLSNLLSVLTEIDNHQISYLKLDYLVTQQTEGELIRFLCHKNTRNISSFICYYINTNHSNTSKKIDYLNQTYSNVNLSFSNSISKMTNQ